MKKQKRTTTNERLRSLIYHDRELLQCSCGSHFLVGVDEVGRGPLAGPVVAASVVMPLEQPIFGVDDSKKLTEQKRDQLSPLILARALCYAIKLCKPKVIDEINIRQATLLVMKEAVTEAISTGIHHCVSNISDCKSTSSDCDTTTSDKNGSCGRWHREPIVLVDGRDAIETPSHQLQIIGGDSKSYHIACASIIAKVFRDNLMKSYEDEYPGYFFAEHKGYGTKKHLEALNRLGPCPIHRRSFKPVSQIRAIES